MNVRCKLGKHDWEVDMFVITTNPPIYHRECLRCGKLDHTDFSGDWTGEACFCQQAKSDAPNPWAPDQPLGQALAAKLDEDDGSSVTWAT